MRAGLLTTFVNVPKAGFATTSGTMGTLAALVNVEEGSERSLKNSFLTGIWLPAIFEEVQCSDFDVILLAKVYLGRYLIDSPWVIASAFDERAQRTW